MKPLVEKDLVEGLSKNSDGCWVVGHGSDIAAVDNNQMTVTEPLLNQDGALRRQGVRPRRAIAKRPYANSASGISRASRARSGASCSAWWRHLPTEDE